jgi:hypothetical protein
MVWTTRTEPPGRRPRRVFTPSVTTQTSTQGATSSSRPLGPRNGTSAESRWITPSRASPSAPSRQGPTDPATRGRRGHVLVGHTQRDHGRPPLDGSADSGRNRRIDGAVGSMTMSYGSVGPTAHSVCGSVSCSFSVIGFSPVPICATSARWKWMPVSSATRPDTVNPVATTTRMLNGDVPASTERSDAVRMVAAELRRSVGRFRAQTRPRPFLPSLLPQG